MSTIQQTLKPLRTREIAWRGLYGIVYEGSEYVAEVDYFDIRERINLYRDGHLLDSQGSPAKFVLKDGTVIKTALSLYGMKTACLVPANGAESQNLTPLPGTAEERRARFSRRYPILNRCISIAAWTILAVALITQLPNLINGIGYFVGFSVPTFNLPEALNIFLSIAGIAAGLDRGLRMKHNPLLDD